MPARGQSLILSYTAWDTVANAPKAGDTAHHTIYWCKDGVTAATTNAPAGITSPADVGESKVTLTAAECTASFGKLTGTSSTSGVVIIPVPVGFDATIGSGLVAAGSTANMVVVTGYPAGKQYAGQRLQHGPSGECRYIQSQEDATIDYVFTLGTGTYGAGTGEDRDLSADPTAGDAVTIIP